MFSELRNQLMQYKDWFFMAYFLPLTGCVAMGVSSAHIVYKLCFLLGVLFLAVKVWLTDYEKYEIINMMFFMALLGYVFFRTREKSLIVTTVTIFGCKNVDIRRVLKYTLFVYIIGVSVRMGLSWFNILPGEYHLLSKFTGKKLIYDFGFSHPNSAYNHIFMIIIMIIAVWQDKVLWYHYILMSIAMVLFYKLFYSRTGILIYLVLCSLILTQSCVKNNKIRNVLGTFYLLVPLITAILSFLLLLLYPFHISYIDKLNEYLSGRIYISYNVVRFVGVHWFGSIDRSWTNKCYIDNAYINLLINFGILIIIIFIIFNLVSAIYYWKNKEFYVLVLLAVMSIYAFMEYSPVNITWNPILLFIGDGLYKSYGKQYI